MKERLKIYLQLMDEEVKPEEMKCAAKLFFKIYSSFHLVTASDGVKARCSCPASRHGMLAYDGLFHIGMCRV